MLGKRWTVLRALKHRDFRLFFFGQGVSLIGTWMQQVAMIWLIYRLSHSAFLLGLGRLLQPSSQFLLGPVGGRVHRPLEPAPDDHIKAWPCFRPRAYAGDPGRFSQELRDRLGVAYEVSISYDPRLRGGSLIIRAATDSGDALLKALREEIQRINSSPITYRDFRAAVSEAVGAYAIRQQARSAQISAITENALAGKGIEEYRNFASGLQDVNDQDLKAVIQKIFNMDRAVVLHINGKTELRITKMNTKGADHR